MIEELVFTSAKRGLQVGKKGFCTVASTPGMAANMARVLESLSGYRHLYKPNSEKAHLNPVVYSHLKQRIGGQEFSILSRIADAGHDYSNRSNKLAHHVVIKEQDLGDAAPSSILRGDAVFISSWNEDPKSLPPRTLNVGADSDCACNTWKQVTGDAGWAGVVADSILEKRTVCIIRQLETPAIHLLHEVLRLLPHAKQWQTTFSTYFTKLPPKFECQVKFLVKGTPEVSIARRSESNFVLDLTGNLPTANSKNAEKARLGQPIAATSNIALSSSSVRGPEPESQDSGSTEGPSDTKEILPKLTPPTRRVRQSSTSEPKFNHTPTNDSAFNRGLLLPLAALIFGILAAGVPSFLFMQQSNFSSKSKIDELSINLAEQKNELAGYQQRLETFLGHFEDFRSLDAVKNGFSELEIRLSDAEVELKSKADEMVRLQDDRESATEDLQGNAMKFRKENNKLKKEIAKLKPPSVRDFKKPDLWSKIAFDAESLLIASSRSDMRELVKWIDFSLSDEPEFYTCEDPPEKFEINRDQLKIERAEGCWKLKLREQEIDQVLATIRFDGENRLKFIPECKVDSRQEIKLAAICGHRSSRLLISVGDNVIERPFRKTSEISIDAEVTNFEELKDRGFSLDKDVFKTFDSDSNTQVIFQLSQPKNGLRQEDKKESEKSSKTEANTKRQRPGR